MHKEAVNIKGTKNGLLILCNPAYEFNNVKSSLIQKLDSANGFFKGATFILHHQLQSISENQLSELDNICQSFGLIPSTDQEHINNLSVESIIKKAHISKSSISEPINSSGEPTLLVQKNLRSGQKISYPGHIVVLGNINRGAEIIAEGNIVVLGSCCGYIHAGFPDNLKAKVIATHLTPMHLSIGSHNLKISTNHSPTNPEVAYIYNNEIIVQEYLSKNLQAQ